MITIKLPYNSNNELQEYLYSVRKQYSSVVRYSYNRFKENKLKQIDIEHSIKKLNNINLLNSWYIRCVLSDGKNINNQNKDKKIIFGNKYNFIKRLKNKISKEEYQEKRLMNLNIQGEFNSLGNRFFRLNIPENKVIFKPKFKQQYELILPKLSKKYKKLLLNIQEKTENKEIPLTVNLDNKFIYLIFEELKEEKQINKLENRFIRIDLNPKQIGISVCSYENEQINILKDYCYDLSTIIYNIENLKEKSDSKMNKYWNNKLDYEILQISKRISEISKAYNCKFIFVEDLKFKNKKTFQERLNNNLWKRNIFINNLEKRCNINGQKLFKVNPAYSSIIGNVQHDFIDSVNASIEIARRGYEVIILKNKKFYPNYILKNSFLHLWKETEIEMIKNWKEFFAFLKKNSKIKYRVPLNSLDFSVLQFFTVKSNVSLIQKLI